MQQQIINYNSYEDTDENLNINLKKYFMILWKEKNLLISVFILILAFFVIMTFVLPKQYKVNADLYISKTNNSHISEINPFVIDETGGNMFAVGSDKSMNNEMELMMSPLVIDKVIRENNLRNKKLFGIIKTRKTGKYITTEKFLKKNIKFENKKNTNVIEITYNSKNPEQSYKVLNSIITNYVELHKEINSYKSKSDKNIIESEYNKAKAELNKSVSAASGLPPNAVAGAGNLAAMSAFSRAASAAIGNIKGQYLESEKSRVEISENAAKVNTLSEKLEWAKLVDEMSDTSKVILIKEPVLLKDYENTSPKLFINIVLGIIFGIIGALISVMIVELIAKKLSYSVLDDNIIYNIEDEFSDLQVELLAKSDRVVSFVMFDNLPPEIMDKLMKNPNLKFVKADITSEFLYSIKESTDVMLVAKINKTNAKLYKQIKSMIKELNKNILEEILV